MFEILIKQFFDPGHECCTSGQYDSVELFSIKCSLKEKIVQGINNRIEVFAAECLNEIYMQGCCYALGCTMWKNDSIIRII